MPETKVDATDRACAAEDKTAALGPDIDLKLYSMQAGQHREVKRLSEIPEDARLRALQTGVDSSEECRSGSFFQMDHSVVMSSSYAGGLEVMGIDEALYTHPWLTDYWWRAVAVDKDKYTAQAELKRTHGYFLRALPGAKVQFPLQACLYMTQDGIAQNVHNVIIAEEGSELHIITGCTTAPRVRSGLHVGVSEFYVKKNARLTFTMIHNWAEDMAVRPRTAAIVEEGAVFQSNYVCMAPLRTLQAYPVAYCMGENSTVMFNNILSAPEGSNLDVGSRVYLRAKGSSAEVVSRVISSGGNITARGHLVGEVPDIKAHLECMGLVLSEQGGIHAVPELEGKAKDVQMSHEAAVGKVAEEEIQYLMARGLTSEEATSAIVRGFLDVEIRGLPGGLRAELKRAVDSAAGGAL